MCACVRVHACVHACVRAYMFACVRSCVRVRACMCACILVLACVCVRECVHLCSYSEQFGPSIGVREVSSHFVHLVHELLAFGERIDLNVVGTAHKVSECRACNLVGTTRLWGMASHTNSRSH